ncbi:integrase [Polymorphobacter glacialis]|uniref:Integrase n=1 Tax=Sandarakinorhabdus glacialis TaxID=1614636 RepID=A0A916ZPM6_9SPHN|nr:integrase arm-type DNA-binding domain-containing protein [Polymorphobacter glacialis]GGE08137.1 integrase [Polymorphobacter glacialis]
MLTDLQVRKAKPADKPYKLGDSGGLLLFVTPTGFKSWRYKYRFGGKERRIVFGPYPEVSLTEARDARDAARKTLREGRDPGALKKDKAADAANEALNSFERVAVEWHALHESKWSTQHADDVIHSLRRDVFPSLGDKPIAQISVPTVLLVVRSIAERGANETAHRVRQRMSAVFVHGIATGVCETDPAAVVRGALAPIVKGRFPAIVYLAAARTLLQTVEAIPAHPVTRVAHRLLALTGVRCEAIYGAKWGEFENLDSAEPIWRVPKDRMKGTKISKQEHVVPLAPQAVALIRAIKPLTGRGPMVFPNARFLHQPMSGGAIGSLITRAGYKGRHVPHGWRSTFSTIMNEQAEREDRNADRAIINLMLAHVPENDVERAYNRAKYMPRRREIASTWADIVLEGAIAPDYLVMGKRR